MAAKKRRKRDEPLSLYPLDPRKVLRRMLSTPPPKDRPAQKRKKRASK